MINVLQDTNHPKRVCYDTIVTALGMPSGPRLLQFSITAAMQPLERILNQKMVLEDAVLLWVCRGGECQVEIGGVGHRITANHLLILFPGVEYRIVSTSCDFEALALMGYVKPQASYNSLSIIFPRIKNIPVLHLAQQDVDTLVALFDYAKLSCANPNHSHRADLDVGIMSLLHNELADIFLRNNVEVREATPDEKMVEQFGMMLSVSTFEHRDVGFYANHFNLSPKKFATKIKKITGSSPLDMITASVITAAKRLLSSTDLSSVEIAKKLHFSSPSFFCRYFVHHTGKTPSEWRAEENRG